MHIGVDVLGMPHAIMVTTADYTDRKGAIDMMEYYRNYTENRSQIQKVLVDGTYTGKNFADEIQKLSGAKVEVVKRNQLESIFISGAISF